MRNVLAGLALLLWLALWGVAGGLVSLYVFNGGFWLGVIAGVLVMLLASAVVQFVHDALERRLQAQVQIKLERMQRANDQRTPRAPSLKRMESTVASPESAGLPLEPQARPDTETTSFLRKTLGREEIEVVPAAAGPESPHPASGTGSDEPLDVHRLRSELDDLLIVYRSALMFVERLPTVSRHPVRAPGYWSNLLRGRTDGPRPLRQRRRLIVRPLLRVFVEAHIRRQLLHLMRVLRIETLGIHPSDARAKTLEEVLSSLAESEEGLFGWSRLRSAISKAPFVPAALAFAFAIYGVATGVDLTSSAAFGRTAAESARAIGWGGVARGLSVLLLGAVALYTILVSPSAVLGFKRKRALFCGGVTPEGDEILGWPLLWLTGGRTEWERFPGRSIYKAENEVFALFGVKKRHEFAVDLFLSPLPYFLLWGSAIGAAEALREAEWGSVFVLPVLLVAIIVPRIAVLRRRARTDR